MANIKAHLEDGKALLIKGKLEVSDEGAVSIITQELQPLDGARASAAQGDDYTAAEESQVTEQAIKELSHLFNSNAGHSQINFEIQARIRQHGQDSTPSISTSENYV